MTLSISPVQSAVNPADYSDDDDNYRRSYNWQVSLVPTDRWRWATWVASRSSRFVGSQLPPDTGTARRNQWLARLYERRAYPPILWYTPGGALGDESYEFLYRLKGLGTLCVWNDADRSEQRGLYPLDEQNLGAMLVESWDPRNRTPGPRQKQTSETREALEPRFGKLIQQPLRRHPETESENESPLELTLGPSMWFKLEERMRLLAPRQRLWLPRVAIVTYATPQLGCVLAPLAAYVQANLILVEPRYPNNIAELADAVRAGLVDEIWFAGRAASLAPKLTDALRKSGTERSVTLRRIDGEDHFEVSHSAAVLLTAYRYLDWMLIRALVATSDWDSDLFLFLSQQGMRTLYYQVSRVISLAMRLRDGDYAGLSQLHTLYFTMNDSQRQLFIQEFQRCFAQHAIVSGALCIVADYTDGDQVPHNLIDAAAMASRRAAPLLLLRPLTAETSAYIGALTDKIEEHLDSQTRIRDERLRLMEQIDRVVAADDAETGTSSGGATAALEWFGLEQQLDKIQSRLGAAQSLLENTVYKTGEVLYESMIPLAMRKTLAQIQPRFLSVFVQDPNMPIELIRESDSAVLDEFAKAPHSHPEKRQRFWSVRYAIGRVSSVNLYETNLTSNTATFASPPDNRAARMVVLCANPTRDLHYSSEEADSIATLFAQGSAQAQNSGDRSLDWDVVRMDKTEPEDPLCPTRGHFSVLLGSGPRIIHYSGHAFFDNVLPGRSGLLLRDGVLTAADVRFMLELGHRPMIYASACAAGRIKAVSARFTGLAAAFIRAGASCYISSLWSIDDRDAAAMAVSYYQALLTQPDATDGEGARPRLQVPIGECLRRAKREQARDGTVAWASLVLYGDPTMTLAAADMDTTEPCNS